MAATLLAIILIGVVLVAAGAVFRVLGKIIGWFIYLVAVGAVALLFIYFCF